MTNKNNKFMVTLAIMALIAYISIWIFASNPKLASSNTTTTPAVTKTTSTSAPQAQINVPVTTPTLPNNSNKVPPSQKNQQHEEDD